MSTKETLRISLNATPAAKSSIRNTIKIYKHQLSGLNATPAAKSSIRNTIKIYKHQLSGLNATPAAKSSIRFEFRVDVVNDKESQCHSRSKKLYKLRELN